MQLLFVSLLSPNKDNIWISCITYIMKSAVVGCVVFCIQIVKWPPKHVLFVGQFLPTEYLSKNRISKYAELKIEMCHVSAGGFLKGYVCTVC